MSIQWPEQDKSLFRAVLKIAHFTGFSKEEITGWTTDEIEEALRIINEDEQLQNAELFALIDYYILKTTKYTKNVGSDKRPKIVADKQARKKADKEAGRIRSVLTGQTLESEIDKNIRVFQGMGIASDYKVVKIMSVEEFVKEKQRLKIESKSIINNLKS